VAIGPKPWRSVRSLMLRTTSSSAFCNSSARAGRNTVGTGTLHNRVLSKAFHSQRIRKPIEIVTTKCLKASPMRLQIVTK
jgi:hypothetical protein